MKRLASSTNQPKPQRVALDGKPPSRPRGRHALPHVEGAAPPPRPKAVPPPLPARLGFRVAEFAALNGMSVPSVWRGIRDEKIPVVMVGNLKIIPRVYAVQIG